METAWLVVRGVRIPVTKEEFIIGRDESCDLVIDERQISKKHVRLISEDGRMRFVDLGSARGTRYNGEARDSGQLSPGDVLAIGGVEVWFQHRRQREAAPTAVHPVKTAAFDWQPFEAFFERLRSSTDASDLLERLLLGIVEVLNGDRGFVLLTKGTGERLVPVASHRLDDTETFVSISKTIYKRALRTNSVVYIADTMTDNWYLSESQNSLDGESRAIICGPLTAAGRTFGVIYVDGPPRLDPGQLALFEMVNGLAAELLAAANVRKKLLAARGQIAALSALQWEDDDLILGDGDYARELKKQLEVVASQDVSVLITGETGTGKEMVARALHKMSHRRAAAFVPVNCAALPLDIIEAELFGYEKGAFTGAVERRIGRFELSTGGTLFLDEVGELSQELQVKLLRVFQERQITRLGGGRAIPLDFRLICATNQNLEQAVTAGSFRSDLYYRINVFRLHLKPLREQSEAIMPLARHFLAIYSARFGRSFDGFSRSTEAVLTSYGWPGNIRELRNAIERAALVETSSQLQPTSLPLSTENARPASTGESAEVVESGMALDYRKAKRHFERSFFQRALMLNENNITNVAKETGLTRKTIYNKLEQLGMVPRED